MKFTDRFLKVPIKLIDKKTEELTGKSDFEDSYVMILPSDIAQYGPRQDENDENGGKPFLNLNLKSGDRFYVYMEIKEFEKLLNDHQSQ